MSDYDSGDLDAIADLDIHAGYRLVVERITHEITRRREELETDLDSTKTAKVRGQIDGLKTALSIREILQAEIKKELTK